MSKIDHNQKKTAFDALMTDIESLTKEIESLKKSQKINDIIIRKQNSEINNLKKSIEHIKNRLNTNENTIKYFSSKY